MSTKLFLYDHPVSSYAQKVRIALREKGIEFDKETPKGLGLGHPDASFEAANPRIEVPALIDGDFKIFDSTAILMYLEDKYPEKTLLPQSAKQRADARMIEEVCDTHYEAINWAIGEITWSKRATGELAQKLIAKAAEQTQQILNWLTERLGKQDFFNGEKFGYADLCVAPVVNRSVIYGYGPEEGSPLQQWHARVSSIPSVKETFVEVTEGAKQMASASSDIWTAHSNRRREYRDHRLEWMVKNGAIGIVQQGLEDDNIRFSWPHPKLS